MRREDGSSMEELLSPKAALSSVGEGVGDDDDDDGDNDKVEDDDDKMEVENLGVGDEIDVVVPCRGGVDESVPTVTVGVEDGLCS